MTRILILLAMALTTDSAFAQSERTAIKFEIPVLPEAGRYVDMLATPGYGVLALENNGMYASLSSRLMVKSREEFQVRNASVRFVGQKGAIYLYEAGAVLSLGMKEKAFTFPAEIDTTDVSKGRLVIRVYPPLAAIFPKELIDKIEFKGRALADFQSQRKLLDYLDRLVERTGNRERMRDAIAFEAYNNRSGQVGAQGAQPVGDTLSDAVVLLLLVGIWLIGYPIFLLFYRRRSRKLAQGG